MSESVPMFQHPISVEEMWSLSNREDKNWGIEGYEIHKTYCDPKEKKMIRERNELNEKVWARRAHFPKKPQSVDKNGNPVIVKRPNYLDDVIKLANSFYNKEKGERLTEELKDKSLKPLPVKKPVTVNRAPRKLFTEWLIEGEKKKTAENKEKDYSAIKEKITAHNKAMEELYMDKMKKKYVGARRGTSNCDRVNILSEAIYVGEQVPFYSTAPPKEGLEEKYEYLPGGDLKGQCAASNAKERKTKKFKVIFFPRKYCLSNWGKAPSWVYPKDSVKSEKCDYKRIQDEIKEKRDKVVEKLNTLKHRINIDVPQSWFEVNYHNRIYIKMVPPLKKTETYEKWKTENPPRHPGPQQYWKRHPVKYVPGKAKPLPPKPVEPGEGKDKVYILDDKYQMKHVHKKMKSHIF